MAVFRIERTKDYTVMSNHHLRNHELSLKAKGLLSMMLLCLFFSSFLMICCLSTAGRVVRFLDLTLTFLFIRFPPFSKIYSNRFSAFWTNKKSENNIPIIHTDWCLLFANQCHSRLKRITPQKQKASTITAFRRSDTTDKNTNKTKCAMQITAFTHSGSAQRSFTKRWYHNNYPLSRQHPKYTVFFKFNHN